MSETICISGPMDLAQATALSARGKDALRRIAASGACTLFDLAAVTTVDSSALAVIFSWQRAALAAKQTMVLRAVPETLLSLARVYGVEELLLPLQECNRSHG